MAVSSVVVHIFARLYFYKIHMRLFLLLLTLILACQSLSAQLPSQAQVSSYPDEKGFQTRAKGLIEAIRNLGYGERGKAKSKCPDTGLSVSTYALEGEYIYSPYTGRKYLQGPTGFFGPKARDKAGRIIAFGGDAMKYDLPPATAALILDPQDQKALHMIGIPGYLNQQFFFPAVNWTRLYGLLGDKMSDKWKDSLKVAVANYINYDFFDATGRASLGKLSFPHSLIGQPGELLGGNAYDGGTENHKTMWRTSGLLYSQWFDSSDLISKVPAKEAETQISLMLRDYLYQCLHKGNGEYLSSIYYPYAMMGYLNLYDFSPDEEIKKLAQAQLDYYLATYALCSLDGVIAGPQRRGYLSAEGMNEMERYLWLWAGSGPWKPSNKTLASKVMLHPLSSSYRPNEVIYRLLNKEMTLPYEAYIAHPSYHIKEANVHQQYLYMSESFSMGSTTLNRIDNPNQQVRWSMLIRDDKRPLNIGGGHPRFYFPSGHSPYSQILQKRASIIVLSGQHEPLNPPEDLRKDRASWYYNIAKELKPTVWPEDDNPESWISFLQEASGRAETWLFIPKSDFNMVQDKGNLFFEFDDTYLAVRSIGKVQKLILPENPELNEWINSNKQLRKSLKNFDIWIISGAYSGFVLDAAEAREYASLKEFQTKYLRASKLLLNQLQRGRIQYHTLLGDQLSLQFDTFAMKGKAKINGRTPDYKNWANGGVYESPYLSIKDGLMRIGDGKSSYEVKVDDKLNLSFGTDKP